MSGATSYEPPLPEILAQVAEACGRPAAEALAARFGGRPLYIPKPDSIGEDHPMAQALGLACARKVAAALGHHRLIVPLGPQASFARRARSIRELSEQGKSNREIARVLSIHLRTVERHVSPSRRTEPEQISLFPLD